MAQNISLNGYNFLTAVVYTINSRRLKVLFCIKEIVGRISCFFLYFNSCYLKLLIPQSKFSGTRKFT